jgi:hypothetical protein
VGVVTVTSPKAKTQRIPTKQYIWRVFQYVESIPV